MAGLMFSSALAAEAPPLRELDDPNIHGIFDTELPRTEWRHSLRLIFHPHFGDFTQRDHLRIPSGVRYGFTEHLEATLEADGYVSHGLGDVSLGRRFGISGARATAKYRWPDWLQPQISTASGISVSSPLGNPPAEITDGLRHVTPFITFAHLLEQRRDVTGFVSFAYDATGRTNVRGMRRKNAFVDDSWSVTPGFIWRRGAFTYTLEASLASSAGVAGTSANVVSLRPAIIWELPRTFAFRPEGRWVVGLGLRAGFGPDGTDLGVSGKIRGDFDFRQLFGRRR